MPKTSLKNYLLNYLKENGSLSYNQAESICHERHYKIETATRRLRELSDWIYPIYKNNYIQSWQYGLKGKLLTVKLTPISALPAPKGQNDTLEDLKPLKSQFQASGRPSTQDLLTRIAEKKKQAYRDRVK